MRRIYRRIAAAIACHGQKATARIAPRRLRDSCRLLAEARMRIISYIGRWTCRFLYSGKLVTANGYCLDTYFLTMAARGHTRFTPYIYIESIADRSFRHFSKDDYHYT